MEVSPPRPVGCAHWEEPERQPDPGNILRRESLDELTPVFGTAVPPRGISGWMRRIAYRIPEHHTKHWLVLLLADRMDALEHNPVRLIPIIGVPLVAGVLWSARARGRRRRGSAWVDRMRSMFVP
jgi:hypothetical protein